MGTVEIVNTILKRDLGLGIGVIESNINSNLEVQIIKQGEAKVILSEDNIYANLGCSSVRFLQDTKMAILMPICVVLVPIIWPFN